MPHILVVDDDASVCTAIKAILELEGFDVIVAGSGRRALEAIETSTIDVIVVDIFMPGMNGLQTIKEFQRRAPAIPVIAMSGFSFRETSKSAPDFLAMASKLGAAFSLHKPFRPSELTTAIESCLDRCPGHRSKRMLA
jgi:DNA-binding NtrC family response regulator